MQHRFLPLVVVVALVLAFASVEFAQAQGAEQSGPRKVSDWGGQAIGPRPEPLPPIDPNEPFDPRDLSGVWRTRGNRMMTEWEDVPQRTPEGEALFQSRISGRSGPQKEAQPPAFGNDPIMGCNPWGFPRLLFYTGGQMEIFQIPDQDRIIMLFQKMMMPRMIWMDGRALPVDPDPRWLGFSVGRWEGDTLVIETTGFDNRAWLDQWGNVYSQDMLFEERWRRVDRDNLEVVYTLDDPSMYESTWVSDTKVFTRQAIELSEVMCAPLDELFFNQFVRDPAAGVVRQ